MLEHYTCRSKKNMTPAKSVGRPFQSGSEESSSSNLDFKNQVCKQLPNDLPNQVLFRPKSLQKDDHPDTQMVSCEATANSRLFQDYFKISGAWNLEIEAFKNAPLETTRSHSDQDLQLLFSSTFERHSGPQKHTRKTLKKRMSKWSALIAQATPVFKKSSLQTYPKRQPQKNHQIREKSAKT